MVLVLSWSSSPSMQVPVDSRKERRMITTRRQSRETPHIVAAREHPMHLGGACKARAQIRVVALSERYKSPVKKKVKWQSAFSTASHMTNHRQLSGHVTSLSTRVGSSTLFDGTFPARTNLNFREKKSVVYTNLHP